MHNGNNIFLGGTLILFKVLGVIARSNWGGGNGGEYKNSPQNNVATLTTFFRLPDMELHTIIHYTFCNKIC